jgi:hypothetical protein
MLTCHLVVVFEPVGFVCIAGLHVVIKPMRELPVFACLGSLVFEPIGFVPLM